MKPSLAVLLLTLLIVPACHDPVKEAGKSQRVSDASAFGVTQDIVQLRRECLQYQAVHGELPTDLADLDITKTDPWGNEYALEELDGKPDVFSAGPDRKFGTKDDIRAPE